MTEPLTGRCGCGNENINSSLLRKSNKKDVCWFFIRRSIRIIVAVISGCIGGSELCMIASLFSRKGGWGEDKQRSA
jgi:hypothetical protein